MNLSPQQIIVISGLIFILLELFIGIEAGFDLVLLGSIFLVSGMAGVVSGNLSVTLILTVVLTIVYISFGRKIIKQKISVLTQKTNTDSLIGSTGIVLKPISNHKAGRIKVNDEEWRAASDKAIPEGEDIVVTAIEGVTLIVKRKE